MSSASYTFFDISKDSAMAAPPLFQQEDCTLTE
jgi:hypothetical protein